MNDGRMKEKEDAMKEQVSSERYLEYLKSFECCNHLTNKHSLNEYGFWKIVGEEQSCDGWGSLQADLGVVRGRLDNVIKYAVGLTDFWSFGAGGRITKLDPPKKIGTGGLVLTGRRKRG